MDLLNPVNKKRSMISRLGVGMLVKNMSFIAVCGVLAMLHIANAHVAERKVRKIYAQKSELKELRWQYMTLQSDVMYNSTYSQVSRKVEPLSLEMAVKVPRKILVKGQ